MMASEKKRTKVFISYSHADAVWLERLRVHMEPLIREKRVDFWDDTKIRPGMDWRSAIREAIDSASVAILLISADFLASKFIASDELPPLLEAAEKEGALILPIILSPSRFTRTPSLNRFQAVNPPDRPLINMTKGEQEEVFVRAVEAIEEAEEKRRKAGKETSRTKEAERKTVKEEAKQRAEEEPSIIIDPKDGAEMVLVPEGPFLYGSSDDDEIAGDNEKPQRLIELPAFYMDKYPVTNQQYARFLKSTGPSAETLEKWINLQGSFGSEKLRISQVGTAFGVERGYEQHPVIYVSWQGAQAYAEWAGKRLPTEVEWEKAARGTDGRVYPWGNEFEKERCNTYESGIGGTTPVEKYPMGTSPYGCYDMAGNVWEWTESPYAELEIRKVLRGGSWIDNHELARCAYRLWFIPGNWDYLLGFRCARTKR